MRTKNIHYLISNFLVLIILISSCKEGNFDKIKNVVNGSTITEKEATNIFKNIMLIEPVKCIPTVIEKKECIICIADKTGVAGDDKNFYSNPEIYVYKLIKFADKWQVESEHVLYSQEYKYCDFNEEIEVVNIENNPYLFLIYSLSDVGNASEVKTIKFSLVSLNNFKQTTLDYTGYDHYNDESIRLYTKGEFSNLASLSNKPKSIVNFLEEKASKSSLIYSPTSEDLDINSAINHEKKWQIDNSKIEDIWSLKKNTFEKALKITYYDESIFPSDDNTIFSIIENSNFKIMSLFRNNILGYDKLKKKYFPIWVDNCHRGCNKEITFIDDSTLEIYYGEGNEQIVIIDLAKMTYRIIVE